MHPGLLRRTFQSRITSFFQAHLGIALSFDCNFSHNKFWFCYFDLRIDLIYKFVQTKVTKAIMLLHAETYLRLLTSLKRFCLFSV